MLKFTNTNDLNVNIGSAVTIAGFVEKVRNQKTMQFIIFRDRYGYVQLINEKTKNQELSELISSITPESAIEVVGKVIPAPHVKIGNGIEIEINRLKIVNLAHSPLPIDKNSSLELRMDHRFLSLRDPKALMIFKIQTTAEMAMREYWISEGFIEIHSPKLMGVPSESGAELFSLEYFGKSAYLAQSPQFYKQMGIASGFERVFEIGPVFRANPSFTSRHDTEFTSVDTEIAWIESYEDIMSFEEKWLVYVFKRIKEIHGDEIKQLFDIEITIPKIPFPRITMAQAREILTKKNHIISEKDDMDPEGERMIASYVADHLNHEFVFITEYPSSVRPFYHMRPENDQSVTFSYDLIWKGLEVTTGAQREHRYEVLTRQAQEKGLTLKNLEHYLEYFKYGCPPHGGYGFGLTRMLMLLLGYSNVREVTFLYRGPNRLTP